MNTKNIKFILFILALVILGLFFSNDLVLIKNFTFNLISPFTERAANSAGNVGNFFASIKAINSLSVDNNNLVKENNELKAKNALMQEVSHENEILKKELGFIENQQGMALVPARVTNYSPTSFIHTIRLDKGSDDGIAIGKAVLSEGFLIGIVEDVGSNFCDVFLINNDRSLIAAILQTSRGNGVVRGGLNGLIIEDVPLDIKINQNETVVTAGIGDNLPPGIAIGTINKVISSESEIFQRASVKSPVEFGRLEVVFIVK
jgi:rod shape-determining protein MreC